MGEARGTRREAAGSGPAGLAGPRLALAPQQSEGPGTKGPPRARAHVLKQWWTTTMTVRATRIQSK
jgi:hypothetical protein